MRLMNTPKMVEILITNHCNLRCSYCSHKTSAGDTGKDLPTEEWLTFFSELNRNAVLEVTLEGGEAFVRKDLPELIEGIVRNRMRFGILSNGTLITDEMARFLKSTKRCNYIQVSIDGSSARTHDICRGQGSFDAAINGIRTLKSHGIPVAVRATLHKHNIDDIEALAKLLLEDIGLPSFSTNSASFMGLCRQNSDDVQLTVADRYHAMVKLLEIQKKYNGRITADAGPLREAHMWREMEAARIAGKPRMSGRGYLKGCGGVFSKLGVRSDGVMVPCVQMSHVELGRINQDDLKETWHTHPELIRLRNRRDIPLDTFDFCNGCDYIPYCTGSCPAISYTMTGMEDHPAPDTCLKRYLEAGGKIPDDIG